MSFLSDKHLLPSGFFALFVTFRGDKQPKNPLGNKLFVTLKTHDNGVWWLFCTYLRYDDLFTLQCATQKQWEYWIVCNIEVLTTYSEVLTPIEHEQQRCAWAVYWGPDDPISKKQEHLGTTPHEWNPNPMFATIEYMKKVGVQYRWEKRYYPMTTAAQC